MEAKAVAKYVRSPAQGGSSSPIDSRQAVDQVTEILDFTPKHVAKVIGKVLKSAVANAWRWKGRSTSSICA